MTGKKKHTTTSLKGNRNDHEKTCNDKKKPCNDKKGTGNDNVTDVIARSDSDVAIYHIQYR